MRPILGIVTLALTLLPAISWAHEDQGFLYGRIVTRSGAEYEGLLRWGNQEAFWDDLFNSAKEEVPWLEEMEDEVETGGSSVKVFGWKLKISSAHSQGRVFMARFGDIDRIEVTGDDKGIVFMKSGTKIRIEGGSDDVGHKIMVQDSKVGAITVHWEKLESIDFLPTPPAVDPPGHRLYGKLECDAGIFEGFVQWDSQECLSTDLLDGESRDGELAIEMGHIRSIERASRRGALVALDDGRQLELRGTNDVNDENRGIFVEVADLGRVRVYWDEFERVEFLEVPGSGRAYGDYPASSTLGGSVRTREGESFYGTLVLDLDEEHGWEILNGERYGVDYYVPLMLVHRIEPNGQDASRIELHNGDSFVLEKGQDVGESNAGVVVLPDGEPADPIYIAWDEIEEILIDPVSPKP